MRLCIPVTENRFQRSEVCGHFGKSPQHLVVESETGEVAVVIRRSAAEGGECAPVESMLEHGVEAIICHSLGRGALGKLTALGVPVYRTDKRTVEEVLETFEPRPQTLMKLEEVCAGHEGHREGRCGGGQH